MITRRYGLDKTIYEIERLLLSGELYAAYISMSKDSKERFKRELFKVLKEGMFNDRFMRALAKDIISVRKDDKGELVYEYHTDTALFGYIKKYIYHARTKRMLSELIQYTINVKE